MARSCSDIEVCRIYGVTSGVAYTVTVVDTDPTAIGEPPSVIATPN
jgi:hypothetical protein